MRATDTRNIHQRFREIDNKDGTYRLPADGSEFIAIQAFWLLILCSSSVSIEAEERHYHFKSVAFCVCLLFYHFVLSLFV
jgi:hypothetical protein